VKSGNWFSKAVAETQNRPPIKPGDTFRFRVIRWHEPDWEFDCPGALIELGVKRGTVPLIRLWEDGSSIEHMAEDFLIDCVVMGHFPKSEADDENWRGYTPAYLKRKAYRPGVERQDFHVRFKVPTFRSEDEEDEGLSWEDL
jgi:hypothetical protein